MKIRSKIIKLLGGYSREEVLTTAVSELFNTISKNDILKEDKGHWVVGDKVLNDGEKKLLISEAKMFTNTKLWKVLQVDIKYRANKMMFEKAKSELDLTAGKLWLYTLDTIKTRLESLTGERGVFNDDVR